MIAPLQIFPNENYYDPKFTANKLAYFTHFGKSIFFYMKVS